MKRMSAIIAATVILLTGCVQKINIHDDKLYALAYLGYREMGDLEQYKNEYNLEDIPVFYISDGDYYLIMPLRDDMKIKMYNNDIETMSETLIYENESCGAFIVQCNVSDIFPDVTLELIHGEESAKFSPFMSLKDGSVEVGEKGINATK